VTQPRRSGPRADRGRVALRHLRELSGYAATRRLHDRHDREASVELELSAGDLDLPQGLEVQWLGVAGISLAYEGTRLLIDPYVTRLSLADLVRRRVVRPDDALIDRHVPRADAILLGHTHFDHALDAPRVARRDKCAVYGGDSAARLMALHGLGDQSVVVTPHHVYEIGPFEVTFVPSAHSRLVLGLSVPNGGELTCEHVEGLTPQAYCCGQVWGIHISVAGRTFYHQGSADLLDDEVRHHDVDYFLCGIAGRQVTEDYLPRILGKLRPRHVVVMHQDDFFRPLDGPAGFAFGVDLARVPDEVAAVTTDMRVGVLPPMRPLRGAVEIA
jgi:L-ascorbate metabolism protein UlaG (beta-lactamase superfamily)